jgi:hypothetical protein
MASAAPPGRARITRCGACQGSGRDGLYPCPDCEGTGKQLWKACPHCGDIGYDRLGDGTYACRISCGYTWTEDDPGWQAQRLPAGLGPQSSEDTGVTVTITPEGFRPFG